jgi:hypothetical protein
LNLSRDFDNRLRHGLGFDPHILNGFTDNGFVDPSRVLMPADFNPQVFPAARGDDAETLAGSERGKPEVVLDGADVVERLTRLDRQQLVEHPFDCIERKGTRRELYLARRSDNVRTLARMKDERVSVCPNNGGEE